MKHTALTLMFFIACGTLLWSDPGDTEAGLVPFTWEIANRIQNSPNYQEIYDDLEFFLSKSFFIPPEQNNDSVRLEVIDHTLVEKREQNTSTGIKFNITDAGILRSMEASSEILIITFNDTPLRFIRNLQDRYELFSAEIDKKTYSLRATSRSETELPQLLINAGAGLNNRLEMRVVQDSGRGGKQRDGQSYQKLNTGNPAWQFGDQPSRYIDGQSYVNKKGITAYVMRQNPSVNRETLNRLIDTYISETGIEGINLDIAIAQMLYATNFLRSQRMTTHNYGGLSEQTPGWNGRFPHRLNDGMTEGVRAHIQHLKGYASTRLNRPCVDPRYQVLVSMGYWGNVKTFEQLFRTWMAGSASYEYSINGILSGLYGFSGY
jgi:hypothetical protein